MVKKITIQDIEAKARARKAEGASKIEVALYKGGRLVWVREIYTLSFPHVKNAFRQDGSFAAYLSRPIQGVIDGIGVDRFTVIKI